MSRLAAALAVLRARGAGNGLGVQQAGPADRDERRRQARHHVLRPGRRTARGRLAGRDALPRPRREQDRPGNPARDVAELARRDAARATGLRRAHLRRPRPRAVRRGSSRSTGRARSRTCASSSAGSPRSRASTGSAIGAFGYSYGGGAIWRATAEGVPFAAIEPAITWTDLYSALLPAGPRPLGRPPRFLAVDPGARGSRPASSIVHDAIAGQNLAGAPRVRRPAIGSHSCSARSGCRRSSCRAGATSPSTSTHALTAYCAADGAEAALPRRFRAPAGREPARERRRTSCPRRAHGSTAT